MRIYLPVTAAHLRAAALGSPQEPQSAHAVTPALTRALPDEDEEGLEVSASLCAADASLVLLAEPGAEGLADRRIVIAADVDAEHVVSEFGHAGRVGGSEISASDMVCSSSETSVSSSGGGGGVSTRVKKGVS